jgi:hypothetical protein
MTDTAPIDARSQLLLATLSRAQEPLDSDDILSQATELAMDHLWTPAHLTGLTRKGVAKRCRDLVDTGHLVVTGVGMDGNARRTTPKYAIAFKDDVRPDVPAPPALPTAPQESPYASMDRSQLLVVLDAQDDALECVARFLADMAKVSEKARRRLMSAGLGER